MLETALATDAVYETVPETNEGDKLPLEITNEDNVASLLKGGLARVTLME